MCIYIYIFVIYTYVYTHMKILYDATSKAQEYRGKLLKLQGMSWLYSTRFGVKSLAVV